MIESNNIARSVVPCSALRSPCAAAPRRATMSSGQSGKKKAAPKAKAAVVPTNPAWVNSNMMKRLQSVPAFVCLTILSEGETTNSTALMAAMFDHYHGNASKGILSQLDLFLAGKGPYANFFGAAALPAVSSSSSSSSTAPSNPKSRWGSVHENFTTVCYQGAKRWRRHGVKCTRRRRPGSLRVRELGKSVDNRPI